MSMLQVALKKPESEKIKWKVISDKRPNEKPVRESKFRLDYILGPSEPITTTMKPNITTPRWFPVGICKYIKPCYKSHDLL